MEPILKGKIICWFYTFLLLSSTINVVMSHSIIKTLPGFDGHLPFELETGYVGVDENDDAQLFYYFVKSESNPKEDPVVIWFDGGPGCSSISGFAFEIGPLEFSKEECDGRLPTLVLKPHSWTKVSNVIFLDTPVGTGFSYSRTLEGARTSDILSAKQMNIFLRKWLNNHPDFLKNPIYIAALSYAGLVVPVAAQMISDGNEEGQKPFVNLKGIMLGSAGADRHLEQNSQIQYAHGMGLISNELYESAKSNCNGEYLDVDPSNTQCLKDIQDINEVKQISGLNLNHILEPLCRPELIEPNLMRKERQCIQAYPSLDTMVSASNPAIGTPLESEYCHEIPLSRPLPPDPAQNCLTYGYKHLYNWANNHSVQEALHIRRGTVGEWTRCNLDMPYEKQITYTVDYHLNLSSKGYRSLIYNGDQDLTIPFHATQEWIRSLNFSIVDDWRPWYVDGQVAGYTRAYSNNLTYVNVKGGGHEVPMYKPKECFEMLKRWISNSPL